MPSFQNPPRHRGGHAIDPLIAIGASTGGTEAILAVLSKLPESMPGIVVVQHRCRAHSRRVLQKGLIETQNLQWLKPPMEKL